jgi:hypothetical protein
MHDRQDRDRAHPMLAINPNNDPSPSGVGMVESKSGYSINDFNAFSDKIVDSAPR